MLFLIIGLDAWCIKFLLQVQVLLIRSIGETKMGLNLAELPRPICGAPSGPNASTQQVQAHDTES